MNFFELVKVFLASLLMGASSGFLVRFVRPGVNLDELLASEGLGKRKVAIFYELLTSEGKSLADEMMGRLSQLFLAPQSNTTMLLRLRITLVFGFDAASGFSAGEILRNIMNGLNGKGAIAGDWTVGLECESWGHAKSDTVARIDYFTADFSLGLVKAEGTEGAWVSPTEVDGIPSLLPTTQAPATDKKKTSKAHA